MEILGIDLIVLCQDFLATLVHIQISASLKRDSLARAGYPELVIHNTICASFLVLENDDSVPSTY